MRDFFSRLRRVIFWRSTYLEAELERTRAELARWQAALLESKGLPSPYPRESKPLPQMKSKLLPSQWIKQAQQATQQATHKAAESADKDGPHAA